MHERSLEQWWLFIIVWNTQIKGFKQLLWPFTQRFMTNYRCYEKDYLIANYYNWSLALRFITVGENQQENAAFCKVNSKHFEKKFKSREYLSTSTKKKKNPGTWLNKGKGSLSFSYIKRMTLPRQRFRHILKFLNKKI